ncbi:RagB/SusD family nutrient uptake outer membrane protein [Dysgonomonas sp. ZJ709]|uniref:RagB/SusD family nutrient uptake outer membrane protein n=1 Tax=Dysgonomonas sp. ZJ709 TaxID=2709797 RepID=UPI0013EB6695|nr:RagB/SusD family nutrient uptake outer membrane protein [Dysgonomonas sp. ZJ709]
MKSKLYYITAVVCLLLTSGCSDFLNESDPNSIPSNRFYETEADVKMGANGAYAALRGDGYYKNMYLYTEVRSDNTTQQDPGANSGVLYQFSNFTLMTDNSYVKTHWADLYKCVTRTNVVLESATQVPFQNESDRNRVIAEMHFLRALTYTHLVFQFGDVPIVTKPLRTKDEIWAHTQRNPKSDVYNLIVSDLNVVLQSELPNIQIGNKVGRASKAAANGLLGKVYLMKAADPDFASDRQASLTAAKQYLEAAWALKPFSALKDIDYADVFDKDKQATCSEILFQVMYQSGSSDLSSNFNYIFQPIAMTGLTSVRSGTGNNIPTNDMMGEYEPLDARKDISSGVSGGVNFTRKYTDLDDPNGFGGNKWVILRYADIALMLSEVKMHLAEADAVNYLNMVRDRAGMPNYTGSNLKEAIRHERRVEFAFEGQRWYDLLRLYTKDELITFFHDKGYTNFSEKDFLLPIPYDEHKLDTERMYQNPGYN